MRKIDFSKEGDIDLRSDIDGKIFIFAKTKKKCRATICSSKEIGADLMKWFAPLSSGAGLEYKVVGTAKDIKAVDQLLPKSAIIKRVEVEYHFELKINSELQIKLKRLKEPIYGLDDGDEPKNKGKIKTLIVDDSSTICNLLKKIIKTSDDFEVVGVIRNPLEVDEFLKNNPVDVITLDIHMPEMTGIDLLKIIHPKYSIPTVMITSVSIAEGGLVMEALDSGAVDYLEKPSMDKISQEIDTILDKLRMAAKVKHAQEVGGTTNLSSMCLDTTSNIVVVGSSTGGTKALSYVLPMLPANIPPILIVQHIPAVFSKAFADRLNTKCSFTVKEASHGDIVKENNVYIAPGGKHMKVKKLNDHYKIVITDDPPVKSFRPSVDYLFDSIAEHVSDLSITAVMFTGMGSDGAAGMKKLKEKRKSYNIAQDKESCIVFGMPKEAIKTGTVDQISHLNNIAEEISKSTSNNRKGVG